MPELAGHLPDVVAKEHRTKRDRRAVVADQVFDQNRNACERSAGSVRSLVPSLVEALPDHGIDGRVHGLDSEGGRVDQLAGLHLSCGNQAGEANGVVVVVVAEGVHGVRSSPGDDVVDGAGQALDIGWVDVGEGGDAQLVVPELPVPEHVDDPVGGKNAYYILGGDRLV